jgi:hypothetical protein
MASFIDHNLYLTQYSVLHSLRLLHFWPVPALFSRHRQQQAIPAFEIPNPAIGSKNTKPSAPLTHRLRGSILQHQRRQVIKGIITRELGRVFVQLSLQETAVSSRGRFSEKALGTPFHPLPRSPTRIFLYTYVRVSKPKAYMIRGAPVVRKRRDGLLFSRELTAERRQTTRKISSSGPVTNTLTPCCYGEPISTLCFAICFNFTRRVLRHHLLSPWNIYWHEDENVSKLRLIGKVLVPMNQFWLPLSDNADMCTPQQSTADPRDYFEVETWLRKISRTPTYFTGCKNFACDDFFNQKMAYNVYMTTTWPFECII